MTKFKQKLTTLILSLLLLTAFSAGVLLSVNKPVANAGAIVIDPIAKYEFKDKDNLGKDTMGNYDMEARYNYVADGTNQLYNEATLLEGGGISFDEHFCVAQDENTDMFKDVTAFTLCFELMPMGKTTNKDSTYLGVSGTGYNFRFTGRSKASTVPGQVRLSTHSLTYTHSNATKTWSGYDAPKINKSGEKADATEFLRYVVTVQPGGNVAVYMNGSSVTLTNPWNSASISTSLPEDFAVYPATEPTSGTRYYFSIGSSFYKQFNSDGSASYVAMTSDAAKGSIRNVQFYDFAMDATCVSAYDTNGYITADDISGTKITGAEVDFGGDATSEQLNTEMTAEEMLAKVNDATAVLSLSNGTTANATITWNSVEQVEDKYYAKGTFVTSKLGYANVYGNEISYELPVVTLTALGGEFRGASISTAGDIGLNFYVIMRDGIETSTATMQMVGYDAIEVNGVYVESRLAWAFTYPVSAKDFDKQVSFTVNKVNGEVVDNGATATASVKDYIDYIKEDTTGDYDSVKQLVIDLDTYCKSAQNYFAGNSVEKVTGEVISSSDLGDYVAKIEGEDANVTLQGATLVLETKTMINLYFTANSEVTCLVNDIEVTATKIDGTENLYVVGIEVASKDLGVMQEFKIGGYTVNYSAYSYIETCVDTVSDSLYNVLQAIYDCGVSALKYSQIG